MVMLYNVLCELTLFYTEPTLHIQCFVITSVNWYVHLLDSASLMTCKHVQGVCML